MPVKKWIKFLDASNKVILILLDNSESLKQIIWLKRLAQKDKMNW